MDSSAEAPPTVGFDEAARSVLTYLVDHVPMDFWSITRVENGRQTYLYLGDNSYGLLQGSSHPWDDSLCVHMTAGAAPTVAPDVRSIPLYAAAGVNDLVPIGAYAGAPIFEADGSLFGVICGIHPSPKHPAALATAEPLLVLLGQLLTAVLHADRIGERERERAVAAELAAETDPLTGLYNRRAWERMLADEVHRFDRHGDPTIVVMTDLDGLKTVNDSGGHAAGDAHLRSAAGALLDAVRRTDVVARLGGDEFGVLLRDCDERAADARIEEIHRSMGDAGVATSVGWAPVTIRDGLDAALVEADQALYVEKRARRARRKDAAPPTD